jgi:hypothetical protein
MAVNTTSRGERLLLRRRDFEDLLPNRKLHHFLYGVAQAVKDEA